MKKIRGQKRKLKQIEYWKINSLNIHLNYLLEYNRDYVKFRIFPWNPVAMSFNNFPNPKGKIRKKIIESFLEIYESWNIQLKALEKPYYLKIWLFEPDIYNSQVVCAINDHIEYYENIFYKPEIVKSISKSNLNNTSSNLDKYIWTHRIDEYPIYEIQYARETFSSEKEYAEELRWFKNELKKPHTIRTQEIDGKTQTVYFIQGSNIWLGESNNLSLELAQRSKDF